MANETPQAGAEPAADEREDTSPSLPGGAAEDAPTAPVEADPAPVAEPAKPAEAGAENGDAKPALPEDVAAPKAEPAVAKEGDAAGGAEKKAGEEKPAAKDGGEEQGGDVEETTDKVAWVLGLSRQEVGFMFAVLVAGLIGAWCAKIVGKDIMVFKYNEEIATPVGWLGSGFIGAIAAGLGVYLLANSDTKDRARTIFFAVGCGLCGQIIIAKTISTIEDSVGMKGRSAKAQKALIELKESIARGTNSTEDEPIAVAHDWIIALIERARAAESSGDFDQTAQIEQQASDLVTSIVVLSKKNPVPVLEEMRRIIAWADQNGADQVKRVSLEAVRTMLIKATDEEFLEAKAVKAEILAKWKNEGTVVEETDDAPATAAVPEPPAPARNVASVPELPNQKPPVVPGLDNGDPSKLQSPPPTETPRDPAGGSPPPVSLAPEKAASYVGRVYLEVDRESLKMDLTKLKSLAGAQGYSFIVPKSPSDPDARECRVQYYLPEDKAGAENLLRGIAEAVGPDVPLKRAEATLVKGLKSARPKHYDLRIGRDVIEALLKNAPDTR